MAKGKRRQEIVDIVESEYRILSKSQVADRWYEFFNRFQQSDEDARLYKPYVLQVMQMGSLPPIIYGDAAKEGPAGSSVEWLGRRIFQVDYNDLVYAKSDHFGLYDSVGEDQVKEEEVSEDPIESREVQIKILCYGIRNDWPATQEAIRDAVWRLLKKNSKSYADKLEREHQQILVTVTNYELTRTLNEIGSADLGKFIRTRGVISEFDDQRSVDIYEMGWKCRSCEKKFSTMSRKTPAKCPYCSEKLIDESPEDTKTVDFMYFVIQDPNDRLRQGQLLPSTYHVCVYGSDMVESVYNVIKIGESVAVNGVVTFTEFIRGNSTQASLEIDCAGIEIVHENQMYNEELKQKVSQPISDDEIDDHYEKMKMSVAPHLEGLDAQKEATLLMLAGSPPLEDRYHADRIRGEIQMLLLGDASTGKTAMLKFAKAVNKKAVYVQGQNASKVGLTASVKNTEILRAGVVIKKTSLSAGVYGMASKEGGLVCLDELSKVSSKEHLEAISSAMDDYQTMYVHKNVAHTEIRVNCASLHAANPITNLGKYDVTKDPQSQTNFADWLWSRYDLKFLHLSRRDETSRHLLWQKKADSYSAMQTQEGFDEEGTYHRVEKSSDVFSIDELSHEIAFLRESYHPKLEIGKMAWLAMIQFWNWHNAHNIMPTREAIDNDQLSFTPMLDERAINSIIRLAQASARLHRRNIVSVTDMSIALNLTKISIAQFTPKIDESDNELRAIASATVLLNESLKKGVELANKRMNEDIQNFARGMMKAVNHLHKRLFIKCNECHATGHMTQGVEGFGDPTHVPCHACLGLKGTYETFDFHRFRDWMIEARVSTNIEPYFNLLRKARMIEREKDTEGVMTVDSSPSLSGIWKVVRDLQGNALVQVMKEINKMWGVPEPESTASTQQYYQQRGR